MNDIDEAFERGRRQGFREALERVVLYANCVAGVTGYTCKWFAKNCQDFIPKPKD